MADPRRRSALEGHLKAGEDGAARPEQPGVELTERRPGAIVQIDGTEARDPKLASILEPLGLEPPEGIGATRATGDLTVLGTGPGQWLLVATGEAGAGLAERLGRDLAGSDLTRVDLGHARTVVRVAGPAAVEVLLKGCPLDLEEMARGTCAGSRLGPFSVLLHRLDGEIFDVYAPRSFGLSVWEWLGEHAAELGYRVRPDRGGSGLG